MDKTFKEIIEERLAEIEKGLRASKIELQRTSVPGKMEEFLEIQNKAFGLHNEMTALIAALNAYNREVAKQ